MGKRGLSSNYSTLRRKSQGFFRKKGLFLGVVAGLGWASLAPTTIFTTTFATGGISLLSAEQKASLKDNCTKIKDVLGDLQHRDSRARVYLGRQYETLLSKFITPLNLRLVENNLSSASLLENQTNFAALRAQFVEDYIRYQQSLEELVSSDCRAEPEKFYEKLVLTREKRAKVASDTQQLKALANLQVELTEELKLSLKRSL